MTGLPWSPRLPGLPWLPRLPGVRRRRSKAVEPDAVVQAGFGHDDEEPDWVDVYWAHAVEEAHVVRGALESEGIPAVLKSRESSLIYGSTALLGVGVYVPRALEDRARAVLEGTSGEYDDDDDVSRG